ncbi:hypothetical protein MKX01_003968 [Papaver californicum]|nr:hypothetical protein MKX01_003968 [Papaver californicum]
MLLYFVSESLRWIFPHNEILMAKNNREEPSTAPQSDQWYNLTLGSSFKDDSSTKKFCTLRYEFKPASIDKNQPGSLHKNKDNKVTVEFHNNLPGKPNVTFEGSSEDYKDNDAVLFFDGNTFRLERLHRAVKRLRHVRLPGDSLNSAVPLPSPAVPNQYSSVDYTNASPPPPPLGKSVNLRTVNKTLAHPSEAVEVEQVGIGESDPEEGLGTKATTNKLLIIYLLHQIPQLYYDKIIRVMRLRGTWMPLAMLMLLVVVHLQCLKLLILLVDMDK